MYTFVARERTSIISSCLYPSGIFRLIIVVITLIIATTQIIIWECAIPWFSDTIRLLVVAFASWIESAWLDPSMIQVITIRLLLMSFRCFRSHVNSGSLCMDFFKFGKLSGVVTMTSANQTANVKSEPARFLTNALGMS